MPKLSLCALVLTLLVAPAFAQTTSNNFGEYVWWPYSHDSGLFTNSGLGGMTAHTHQVVVPGAASVRLTFENVVFGAPGDHIRIVSNLDGHSQELTMAELAKWRNTSAYFNGESVLVSLVLTPASSGSFGIRDLMVGVGGFAMNDTICGATDDRCPSMDWRSMRAVSNPTGSGGGCTIWTAGSASGNCVLSAGHCTGTFGVAEAEVPMSTSSGAAQHPAPNRQWPINPIDSVASGVGNDWAISTLSPNAAGELPHQLYGSFDLGFFAPAAGQTCRITGYGSVSSGSTFTCLPPGWVSGNLNVFQKTHTGPFVAAAGTSVRYSTDTSGGNSGSPVIDESSGMAVGIHTHGGCSASGGSNAGTSLTNPGFQASWAVNGCTGPSFSLTFSSTNGNLVVDLQDIPAGTTSGYTAFSFNTSLPIGQGSVFGINPDYLTLTSFLSPAAPGNVFHWLLPVSGVFPDVAFALPPGSLSMFAGMTADAQAIAFDGSLGVLDITNVVREAL